ncbi:MAG: hypothetical protein AB7O65_13550 [Candidatus Korobacteraceae bacterium]
MRSARPSNESAKVEKRVLRPYRTVQVFGIGGLFLLRLVSTAALVR